MATCADMLSDLNDRINDVANAQVTEAQKIKYLNHGLRAMWPRIYRTVVDTSLVLAVNDYEYTIPSTQDYGLPWRVEIETGSATNIYQPLDEYEIINTVTGKAIRLKWLPASIGARFRVTSAVPLTPFVTSASTYDGPPITEELPVWYALGITTGRRLEDRTDYRRYSTTVAQNGVDINEVMNASQFAFAQFELLLERYTMPMPVGAP